MFKAVVGQIEGIETGQVIEKVISQCKEQLGPLVPKAGILFAASGFDYGPALFAISMSFPGIKLCGCTTGGEMSSSLGFSQDSMSLMLFASDSVSVGTGLGPNLAENPAKAVAKALDQARESLCGPPKACFMLPGIMGMGMEEVIDAAHEQLGPDCQIFGGFAGTGGFDYTDVFQFRDTQVARDSVAILLFSGNLRLESNLSQSWKPVGSKGVVTEAKGNSIKSISGRTALQFYREAFGPYAEPLPEMPLAILDENDNYYLRSAAGFDEQSGEVDLTTSVPAGKKVQLTEASPEGIIASTRRSFSKLTGNCCQAWVPQAAILFSCVSRKLIMGQKTGREIVEARKHLPANIPVIGFYTLGEISALAQGQRPRFHNCTLVTVVIGEEGHTSPLPEMTVSTEYSKCSGLNKRKLAKALESQNRLELQKEYYSNSLKRMAMDLETANRKIKEQNQILKESLTLAQEVQQSLLPGTAPVLDGFDIAGKSVYCDQTGGDYLDYLPFKNGLSVVVGDVSGHGVAAALLMTTARALLRMRVHSGGTPAQLISDLNQLLTPDVMDSNRFMTLLYVYLDPREKRVTWVRAGHEPAILCDPETGEHTELRGNGLSLGITKDYQFEENLSPDLEPGQILIMSTDGVTEARNPENEMFGRPRLVKLVQDHARKPAREILDICLAEVAEHRAGLKREDDETLVIIKVL